MKIDAIAEIVIFMSNIVTVRCLIYKKILYWFKGSISSSCAGFGSIWTTIIQITDLKLVSTLVQDRSPATKKIVKRKKYLLYMRYKCVKESTYN